MKVKNQQDFAAGLLFLSVGIACAVGASKHVMGSASDPGPGYFPVFLGGLIALLGAWILFFSLTLETDGGDPLGALAWRPLLVIVGVVVLSGVLLPKLGLLITSPLLVILASLAARDLRWHEVVLSATGATLLAYLVFVVALKRPIALLP